MALHSTNIREISYYPQQGNNNFIFIKIKHVLESYNEILLS